MNEGHERRARERVRPARGVELVAEINAGPGKCFRGAVVDTSCDGARLTIDQKPIPRFHLGTPVEVRFFQRGVGRAITAMGQITHQTTVEQRATVGIRFTQRESFYEQLIPELWKQFNRRAARRAPLSAEARIESGGHQWAVQVHDVSTGGISIETEPLLAEELADYELLRFYCKLPGKAGVLALSCILVHQTPFGPSIRHGLQFAESLSVNLSGQQERIAAFVRASGD